MTLLIIKYRNGNITYILTNQLELFEMWLLSFTSDIAISQRKGKQQKSLKLTVHENRSIFPKFLLANIMTISEFSYKVSFHHLTFSEEESILINSLLAPPQ